MEEIKKSNIAPVGKEFFFIISALLMIISVSMFTGCGGGSSEDSGSDSSLEDNNSDSDADTDSDADKDSDTDGSSSLDAFDISIMEDDYDGSDYEMPSSGIVDISFNSNSIEGATGGASADGTELTISSAGTYRITGELTDGRIVVDTEDEEVVRLVFNGIDVTCSDSAPVYVANAERTAIILAAGTTNLLTDTSDYIFEADEDEPNATLHSKDYLTIGGTGSLTVNGNYNDGITSKDGLIINSGTITVSAPDDGIRGKDYLIVKDGTLNVTTTDTGDGLLADNEEDTERGYIIIEDGFINITAKEDGIQAETYVIAYGGDVIIESGGGSGGSLADDESKKGIKGLAGVLIDDGDFTIDSADDAVHSNDFLVVNEGDFDLATGDDGMHADLSLEIYGGDFSVSESYEGIESSVITIDDGNFYIVSDDDGLNCAGGNDGSGFTGGRDGGMPSSSDGDYSMTIDGGYLAVYAQGDGLDSNGDIQMTAGTVIIHGPTGRGDGIMDSGDMGGSILIDGGFLVGAGSSGMSESPDADSGQNFKLLTFDTKSAGTLFHIESSGGADIVTFEPSKQYQSVVISSPDLEGGTTYNVYFGGSSTRTETDGLYEGGSYSGGTQDSSFSL